MKPICGSESIKPSVSISQAIFTVCDVSTYVHVSMLG